MRFLIPAFRVRTFVRRGLLITPALAVASMLCLVPPAFALRATVLTLTIDPNPGRIDQLVKATARVTAPSDPTAIVFGLVTFYVDGSPLYTVLSGGQADEPVIVTPAGNHEVRADFQGNNDFGPSSATQTYTLLPTHPAIASITPGEIHAGSSHNQIAIRGTDFTPGSKVLAGETELQTVFASPKRLRALLRPSMLDVAGTIKVTVKNGDGQLAAKDLPVAGPDSSTLKISFESSAVVASGITPHGKAVMLGAGYDGRIFYEFEKIGTDVDGRGSIRFETRYPIPPSGGYGVADITAGEWRTAGPGPTTPEILFPARTVEGASNGHPTRLSVPDVNLMLWIRPGVGVWDTSDLLEDATNHDADLAPNGRVGITTSSFASIDGGPPPPAYFEPDDVLIAIALYQVKILSARVGDLVEDADDAPTVSVEDIVVPSNVSVASFVATLSSPLDHTVTVDYKTEPGSAVAQINYVATNGTLTFAPGETLKTINVPVVKRNGTTNRSLFLSLNNASGAGVGFGHAMATLAAPPRHRRAAPH